MVNLPAGTVTFVFTDIVDSTALLTETGDADYAALLAIHRRLVRDIFAAHEGHEIDTQGDAFFYSFMRARQAVAAAIEVQRAHAKTSWPGGLAVRIRVGLHTGEPAVGDEGYTGIDVVRAARIASLGGGGQVLLSDTTRAIATRDLPDGVSLRSLGERDLKGIDRPEPIWALDIDGTAAEAPRSEAPEQAVAAGHPSREADASDTEAVSPFAELIRGARERIEARVLTELEASLPEAFTSPSPTPPPSPPPRSVTREIARLHELREEGALTEEQYQRMVDRLLEPGDKNPG